MRYTVLISEQILLPLVRARVAVGAIPQERCWSHDRAIYDTVLFYNIGYNLK